MTKAEKTDISSGADLDTFGNKSAFSKNALAKISSLQDALDALAEIGANVEDFADYGDGFSVVKDKNTLAGKPFVIMHWAFKEGTFGAFVICQIVTESGEKLVLMDGSTGILEQLQNVTEARKRNGLANGQFGLIVRNGLRVSNYTYESEGKIVPASTWYLAE